MLDPTQRNNVDEALDSLLSSTKSSTSAPTRKPKLWFRLILCVFCILVIASSALYFSWWQAPSAFPQNASITIKEGTTLSETTTLLREQNAIRSAFLFKAVTIALRGEKGLKAGEYYFEKPLSVLELSRRLTGGFQNLTPVRVTVPEGLSNREIAAIFSKALVRFDSSLFLQLAKAEEGYLFPDTYTLLPNATEEVVIDKMQKNFTRRLLPLAEKLASFGKPLKDIITMASLVEGEARTLETRKYISGILWHRLEIGMPLQVDAVFPYILGKNTYEVTTEDLKFNSPYNTYRYAGLPPGPISNPSLGAIEATLSPTKTNYLYYLTDNGGTMRYAVSHAEHLVNRAKFLGK